MKLIINNLRLPYYSGLEELKKLAAGKLNVRVDDIEKFRIIKESTDARRKPDVSRVYSIAAEIDNSAALKRAIAKSSDIRAEEEAPKEELMSGSKRLSSRPVVVGSGPAGIFAALELASHGYRPIVLERGGSVEERTDIVNRYWKTGLLDPETNVQFGEGGAGTFSDGKLTTRINDRRCEKVIEQFYKCGAHEDILYRAKPHIGSDVLKEVVVNMRNRLVEMGGEIRFKSKVTSISIANGKISGLVINGGEELSSEVVVLAIGHSARDTYESLLECGVMFEQKAFSIGVRIEHPQEMINLAQYGSNEVAKLLGAADYQLFYKMGERTAYSFCMCPGGIVVAAASEPDMTVTNGMSEYLRDRENANSALVVSVGPKDFGSSHALAGVEFQRMWERKAFTAGGGRSGGAPVQRLEDFIDGRASKTFGSVKPSYTGNIMPADINECLPVSVTGPMKEAVSNFDRKLKGFAMKDALLTGVETRTSSPVRMPRGETLEALGIDGLYPAGEGAGYAGGIVSAAVDGIRVAEQIIRTFAQPSC